LGNELSTTNKGGGSQEKKKRGLVVQVISGEGLSSVRKWKKKKNPLARIKRIEKKIPK